MLFATFDHDANAASVGLTMPATTVLVFGNSAVGTRAMLANPDPALELPSRVLVREADDGVTELLFTDPTTLGERYGLPDQQVAGLARLVRLVESALIDG